MAGLRGKGGQAKRSDKNGAASKDVAPFLRSGAEWKGYVNVEFSETEKERFRTFVADADLVREITAQVLLEGYKITCVQVDNDETVKATAFSAFSGRVDSGLAVSAWAADFYDAVCAVAFIVGVHSQFNLAQHETEKPVSSRRTF